jgi:hypothetical protein
MFNALLTIFIKRTKQELNCVQLLYVHCIKVLWTYLLPCIVIWYLNVVSGTDELHTVAEFHFIKFLLFECHVVDVFVKDIWIVPLITSLTLGRSFWLQYNKVSVT